MNEGTVKVVLTIATILAAAIADKIVSCSEQKKLKG